MIQSFEDLLKQCPIKSQHQFFFVETKTRLLIILNRQSQKQHYVHDIVHVLINQTKLGLHRIYQLAEKYCFHFELLGAVVTLG